MKESSNQSKTVVSDKFYDGKRRFVWPRRLFVELTLSAQDVQRMARWSKRDEITPVWFANSQRVLFVNWTLLEKWKSRKWPR